MIFFASRITPLTLNPTAIKSLFSMMFSLQGEPGVVTGQMGPQGQPGPPGDTGPPVRPTLIALVTLHFRFYFH